ncbi:hypothetical protein GCM10027615_21630 [Plantactinospora veratri]
MRSPSRSRSWSPPSAFAGFRFPSEVIILAVRWYLRFNLSYRDVEELLVERGVQVDHVTVYRWVQRFLPLLVDAARFHRHAPGDRYVHRAVDQHGQVIDVLVSARRDAAAARRFFQRALRMLKVTPAEVVTDASPVYPAVLDDLVPSAWHHVERYANNPIEADHSQLKHRLRPMRGLRTDRNRPGGHRRTRVYAEPTTRTLRTRTRGATGAPGRRSVHRARPSDLIPNRYTRLDVSTDSRTQQRGTDWLAADTGIDVRRAGVLLWTAWQLRFWWAGWTSCGPSTTR